MIAAGEVDVEDVTEAIVGTTEIGKIEMTTVDLLIIVEAVAVMDTIVVAVEIGAVVVIETILVEVLLQLPQRHLQPHPQPRDPS